MAGDRADAQRDAMERVALLDDRSERADRSDAKTLPNGEKKVHIAYQGSRPADAAAANKAAKLERTPRDWSWHHDEAELGAMYLVPDDLHAAVKHSGGVAEYKHRQGATSYGD